MLKYLAHYLQYKATHFKPTVAIGVLLASGLLFLGSVWYATFPSAVPCSQTVLTAAVSRGNPRASWDCMAPSYQARGSFEAWEAFQAENPSRKVTLVGRHNAFHYYAVDDAEASQWYVVTVDAAGKVVRID